MPIVNSMKSTVVNNTDHILRVIENYKSGGISVLENLNKKT